MQRFSNAPALLRRIARRANVASSKRLQHSTPAVMEQTEYQYQDNYLDVLEHTPSESAYGEYFKQCLADRGVSWQSLETEAFQLLMDEREFDPPAPPRPDSPAWGYMYANNLVDFKAAADNLPSEKEYKRGFFVSKVEALEKKMKRFYPEWDWESKYKQRLAEWKSSSSTLSPFQKAKAEALAAAVAENPKSYIGLFNSNSHFNFGEDDPFHYYMPKENEDNWLNLQKFEWDQATGNISPTYIESLNSLEKFMEPKMAAAKVDMGSLMAKPCADVLGWFSKACPSVEATSASVAKAAKSTSAAKLLLALMWGNCPAAFSQFFVRSGTLESFMADNEAAMTAMAEAFPKMQAEAKKMDAALKAACAAAEKSCKAPGLQNFLSATGLTAAASKTVSEPKPMWAVAKLNETAADLKKRGCMLGGVECAALAAVVDCPDNTARAMYDKLAYGDMGNVVPVVSEAAGHMMPFTNNLGDEVCAFMKASGLECDAADVKNAVSSAFKSIEEPAKSFGTARSALDTASQDTKIDYCLDVLASLSIQYKY